MQDEPQNQQYKEILQQLAYVKKTYLNGTHSTVEELSFHKRFDNRSDNDCENINKAKNRHAKESANGGDPTGNTIFSLSTFYAQFEFCHIFLTFLISNNAE